ncbi:hypothetical protein DPMN_171425 [Dreissena polymorpha]|uniref:Uncharacterized protein n=1 Tax=Dreissena polymorpha TaxID=45954 RepID=A0A9D4DXZ4_DREPO|nr:hypothetical protein DPMN_171425 [Dreissena polymorpha]
MQCCKERLGTYNRLPDSLRRCQDHTDTCRGLSDGVRQSPRPSGDLQETHRQSATVQRPWGFQNNLRRSERLSGTVIDF